ncbi:MAG: hypothetical protein JST23_12745 [Bacteroidetes bacterium]|nr:hypothetical protein [Bacteroidota bacterium]
MKFYRNSPPPSTNCKSVKDLIFTFLAFFVILLTSCSKESQQSIARDHITKQSIERANNFLSAKEILKSVNFKKIKELSEEREVAVLNRQFGSWTGDSLAIEDEAREDLVPIHNDFKQYVMSNYPLMGNIADSIINDPDFTQVIILHNMAEENNFQYVDTTIAYNRSTQSILSCVMGVLTGIGGVGS